MDILELDPAVLEKTASLIEQYCTQQTTIMDDYLRNASTLSAEWKDDRTLGTVLEEIGLMKNSVISTMDEIRSAYPKYFRELAEYIKNRPGR